MYPISASQIKAARALLDWSQGDLADAASVSRTTIRSLEMGHCARLNNVNEIQKAFEVNGIVFLDHEGVKRRSEDIKTFVGSDSCDKFFDDIQKTIQERNCDLICQIDSQDLLTRASGITRRTNLQRLEIIQKITDVKCLISSSIKLPLVQPSFQIRILHEQIALSPTFSFSYDDQCAMAFKGSGMDYIFAVFQKAQLSAGWKNHYFMPNWQIAKPFVLATKQKISA